MYNNNMNNQVLIQFAQERNLSQSSHRRYSVAMNRYTNFHNMNIEELLAEADAEEEARIRWKNRKLKTRLLTFRNSLINEGLNLKTINHYLTLIKAVYKHFDIEVHPLPPLSTAKAKVTPQLFFKDLPTSKILGEAMSISSPIMRAWITAQSSTGLSNIDLLKWTIKDYINFTQEFHEKEDIYEAINVLEQKISDEEIIIPTIHNRRNKTGIYHFTFMSTEAVHEINKYILTRNDFLNEDSQLFRIGRRYLNNVFDEINDKLGLGYRGKYRTLTPYMLRKYHASYLKIGENGLNQEEVNALQGRVKKGSEASYFFDNLDELKVKYLKALPNIAINWEYTVYTVKSKEYIELEEKYNELRKVEARTAELEAKMKRMQNIIKNVH